MSRSSILIVFIVLGFSSYVNGQSIKEKIDKHAKDPKTKEQAAKADLYIVDQRIISDSNTTNCKAKKTRKAESRRVRRIDGQ